MLEKEKKISVIVPVYNQKEKYLDDCITSIRDQKYRNLEIILVDDGSAIFCSELCDDYCLKDNRIKVIHKENGGTASARRVGVQVATGDYVAFVDSDDWIDLDLYSHVVSAIAMYEADMISYGYYRNYENGKSMRVSNYNKLTYFERKDFEKEIFPYFIMENDFFETELPYVGCCYLYKTNLARVVARMINDEIKTNDDYLFLLIALLNAESFCSTPYVGYHYRCNINSKLHILKNVIDLDSRTYRAANAAINESGYNEHCKSILRKKNVLESYHTLMLKDYSILANDKDNYLFPYTGVKKGSKILVYGAGKLGKQIYSFVKNSADYEVIGMADKNWRFYREQGLDVIAPEEILSLDCDYIIIAIIYANIKNQVKKNLLELGICENKIAEIDLSALDEEHLPF